MLEYGVCELKWSWELSIYSEIKYVKKMKVS